MDKIIFRRRFPFKINPVMVKFRIGELTIVLCIGSCIIIANKLDVHCFFVLNEKYESTRVLSYMIPNPKSEIKKRVYRNKQPTNKRICRLVISVRILVAAFDFPPAWGFLIAAFDEDVEVVSAFLSLLCTEVDSRFDTDNDVDDDADDDVRGTDDIAPNQLGFFMNPTAGFFWRSVDECNGFVSFMNCCEFISAYKSY